MSWHYTFRTVLLLSVIVSLVTLREVHSSHLPPLSQAGDNLTLNSVGYADKADVIVGVLINLKSKLKGL